MRKVHLQLQPQPRGWPSISNTYLPQRSKKLVRLCFIFL